MGCAIVVCTVTAGGRACRYQRPPAINKSTTTPPAIQGQRRVSGTSSSRWPRSMRSWCSSAPLSLSVGGGVLGCGADKLLTSARSDSCHQTPCLGKFGCDEQRALERVARLQGGAPIQIASPQIYVRFGRSPAGG